jgi:hypothetical protein
VGEEVDVGFASYSDGVGVYYEDGEAEYLHVAVAGSC